MCGCVQSIPKHHVEHIDFLAIVNLGYENLGVLLKNVDVAEAVFDELRADQLT